MYASSHRPARVGHPGPMTGRRRDLTKQGDQ